MSFLEFISSIAWPATVLVVAFIFRQAIRAAVSGQLKSFKAGPVEAVWQETISEVKVDLGTSSNSDRAELQHNVGGLANELRSLAERSPSVAVREGYERIADELRRTLSDPVVDPHLDLDRLGAHTLAGLAAQHGLIREQSVEAVEGLSVLRNLAAHERTEVTTARALEYLELVDGALFAIRLNNRTARRQN